MSLRNRVKRLTDLARRRGLDAGAGCPACRSRRGRIVQVTSRALPDGTIKPGANHPATCTVCGQFPEKIIEL